MLQLIKLELRRNNLRTYMTASAAIAVVMLGFIYLFAYAPRLEPNDQDMALFAGYGNLIPLFGVLNMAVFCVLSAVMHARFIVEDYSGKRAILLFTYPVSRRNILLAKLMVVAMFTLLSILVSGFLIYSIFGLTEQFMPLVEESFTVSTMLAAMENTLVMSFMAASMGIIAAGVGFIKKSVPTTIITAVILASFLCNIVANATSNVLVMGILALAMTGIGALFSMNLIYRVNRMEVE